MQFLVGPAVLFDWNGTLVDDAARALEAANATLLAFGRAPMRDVAELRASFRLPLEEWLVFLGVPPRSADAAVDRWNEEMTLRPAPLRDGARQLLLELADRAVPTAVVSAASMDSVLADARNLGIDRLFAQIVGDAADKRAVIEGTLSGLGAGEGFYVGDTEFDMTEAAAAGAVPIGISGGYRPDAALVAAGARIVCADLLEVRDLVFAHHP